MNKGLIYFVQPAELIGTNRYKIGCSAKASIERLKDYRKGTRLILAMECTNPFGLERKIKASFDVKFKLIAGNEFFEGDERIMKEDFLQIFNQREGIGVKKPTVLNTENYCSVCDEPRDALYDIDENHQRMLDHSRCREELFDYFDYYDKTGCGYDGKCSMECHGYCVGALRDDECLKLYNEKNNEWRDQDVYNEITRNKIKYG